MEIQLVPHLMLRQHQTWHQTSEFQHGFSWANDSGPERTFPWVNMLNYLFCAPWPCGQTESVWNQVVMTGWGDWDMHTHTNPVAQWWRIEWEISQIGKALDGSAHLFHLLAPLSGLWKRLPVTQHQRCHQQHDTVRSFYSSYNTRLFYI